MKNFNKKVIVTGACGYLGRNIVRVLIDRGYHIISIDIGSDVWKFEDKVDHLHLDLLKEEIPVFKNVQALIHLAGFADLEEAFDEPVKTLDLNVRLTVLVAEYCLKNNLSLIYASSMYACGMKGGFYGASKRAAEIFLESFADVLGLRTTVFRLGSLYGADSDESNGLHRLVLKVLKGARIQVDSRVSREYIHVLDAANQIVNKLQNADGCFEKINLVGGDSILLSDVVEMLAEIIQVDVILEKRDANSSAHYLKSPYSISRPDIVHKLPTKIDFGYGLKELITKVQSEIE